MRFSQAGDETAAGKAGGGEVSTYIDPNTEAWIEQLQARIAELERSAIIWHKYPDEKPPIDGRYLFWDSDGNAPHVLPHNDIVVRDNPGVFSTQTHWAYLPKPPEEKG